MVDRLKSSLTPLEELERALRIDEYALNDVCREHPTLFHRVAREVALAISRRDAAKVDLDRIEAHTALELRDEAEETDRKITVDEIKTRVRENPVYVMAVNQLAIRQDAVGEWSALKESYLQRSYMLKSMVDLYLGQYYSTTERREDREATADIARQRMSEMRRAAIREAE